MLFLQNLVWNLVGRYAGMNWLAYYQGREVENPPRVNANFLNSEAGVQTWGETTDWYTWFTRIFDPENFDSALQGGDQDGCPELLFVAKEAIGGGVLKEGTLAWAPRELLGLKGGGVTPLADKGVFSGVLGVVGLLVVVPLLLTQLELDPGCTPEAVVVQMTISGELDERCGFITSTLLPVNMMFCPTSRATTSVLERSRFRPSELSDSTIVGRSFCFHLWNKQKAGSEY